MIRTLYFLFTLLFLAALATRSTDQTAEISLLMKETEDVCRWGRHCKIAAWGDDILFIDSGGEFVASMDLPTISEVADEWKCGERPCELWWSDHGSPLYPAQLTITRVNAYGLTVETARFQVWADAFVPVD